MPSNLAIDDRLLQRALRVGRHKTKRETVNAALREFIARRELRKLPEIFGSIDYEPDFDYKQERRRR